jgi:hypothetical protein
VKPLRFMYVTQFAQQPHVGLLYTAIRVVRDALRVTGRSAVVARLANVIWSQSRRFIMASSGERWRERRA